MIYCSSREVRGHAPPQEHFVHFKVKCINLVLFERSKLRASTHELLVEQRKRINLYQDNKQDLHQDYKHGVLGSQTIIIIM